jgi:ribonucleotide monophosphatase NagD (HAD superfamily)
VDSQTTVTITADDTITTNSINIDLLPAAETSFQVSCTNPNLTYGTTDNLSLT